MKKTLKLKHDDNQRVFFISDLHFCHDRDFIWGSKGRSYKNVDEMNKHILSVWNSTITDNDIVFNLGDLVFNDSNGKKAMFLMEHLKCKTHYFLHGNHSSGVKQVYECAIQEFKNEHSIQSDIEIYPLEVGKFVFVGNYLEVEVNGQPLVLTHYPLLSWNGLHQGAWNIFGHTHCNLKKTFGKQLDVGWDFKKRPIPFSELKQLLGKKEIEYVDHHG